MKPVVDDFLVVSLEETKKAMRLMAEKARIISEGAGAMPLAAALSGKAGQGPIVAACAVAAALSPMLRARGHRKIVAVVSGGNIDLKKFCELVSP